MASKRVTYKGYKKKWGQIMSDGTPILNDDKKRLQIAPDEKFVQCYVPDHPVRKDYPKYLFVSNKGNFVSVYGNEPRWLTPSYTSNGRESYKLSVKGNAKSTIGYIIVAVCHDAYVYGKANQIMKEKGRKAFKKPKKNDPFRGLYLNVHHNDGYDATQGRAYNNDPETLTILTINVHVLFDCIPVVDAPLSEQTAFMQELGKILSDEEPQKYSLLIPGDDKKTGTIRAIEPSAEFEDYIRKNFLGNISIEITALTDDEECRKDLQDKTKKLGQQWLSLYNNGTIKDRRFTSSETSSSGKSYEYQVSILV